MVKKQELMNSCLVTSPTKKLFPTLHKKTAAHDAWEQGKHNKHQPNTMLMSEHLNI